MNRSKWQVIGTAVVSLLLAAPTAATVKAQPEVKKPAATAKTKRHAWAPETLTGTVMSVDASRHLMVVKGPDNVPFDMRVNGRTRILSGRQRQDLAALAAATNDKVSVRFTPARSGDIASLIRIQK